MDAGHVLREISHMDEKTKNIAIVSLDEWAQFVDQLLEEEAAMMGNLILATSEKKVTDTIIHIWGLVFGKTTGAITEKLFPDAKITKNEKGELKWK